mgnify:CR=1 FL=1
MVFSAVPSTYLLCLSSIALFIGLTTGQAELIDRTLGLADRNVLKSAKNALNDQFTFQGVTGSPLKINHEKHILIIDCLNSSFM